ncbi:HEAT repeat domain-containing protein [Streptomyces sp. NPDC001743]|uniref:HEAT repeat domain-containing protein n=1 Tax=Streptomyces sp. NPDC001743 TaxID=3154397 RepID=UPI00332F657B
MNHARTAALRLAGGSSLREALGRTSAESWPALDQAIRDLPSWELPSYAAPDNRWLRWDWNAPLPSLRRSRRRRAESESENVIALCHPDGRIREAALDRVPGSPALLPLLIVRCADWAAPVRERARRLLSEVPPAGLAPHADLVLLLARREQGGFAADLLDRGVRGGSAAQVESLLASGDRATRRFAHRVAVDRGLLAPGRLARLAADSGDATLQDLCADAALASMRVEDHDDVLGVLLAARAPRVRAAGVTALRRTGRHDEARARLADRSGVVRACARYVVRQGGADPLPLYRAMCGGEIAEPGAAAGLGECGDPSDAETLWALLDHPSPAVRVHAVHGLRALDAVTRDRLSVLIDDPSPAVVRAATRALLPDAAELSREWLTERDAPDRPRAVRVAAQRLLRAAGHLRPTG